MRIVVTGGTGFIGRPLTAHLAALGYECVVLTRDPARAASKPSPANIRFENSARFPAADAVIHLAGESIAGLWTARKKRAIRASRVDGTRNLVNALRAAKNKPHTLLVASAVGIYGHRPGEALDEYAAADPGRSFRSEVCRAWELAANEAETLGIRVINLRFGNVIDPAGGYLGAMLPWIRTLGAFVPGDPRATIPWISREDCVRLIEFALVNELWYGPLNLTAPEPVSQQEFAQGISRACRRRVWGTIPARWLRLALGDLASAMLDDQHVLPAKAMRGGFRWSHPTWSSWLQAWAAGELAGGSASHVSSETRGAKKNPDFHLHST